VLIRALLMLAALAVWAGAQDVGRTAVALEREMDVQTRLPTDAAQPEASVGRHRDGWTLGDGEGVSIPMPGAVLSLMSWALIAVLVVAVLALLAAFFREPLDNRMRAPLGPPGPALEGARQRAEPGSLLARADQCAAEGRFTEAMHCVLLAAMAMLAGERDSLTSWELLRGAKLDEPRMRALRDVVVRVERAWFGQASAGVDDYRRVRSSFDTFAEPAGESA